MAGKPCLLVGFLGAPGAQFDAMKLSWLGTPTIETNVCIAHNTAPVKTVQDLLEKQLVVGDTGPGTGTRSYPKALTRIMHHAARFCTLAAEARATAPTD